VLIRSLRSSSSPAATAAPCSPGSTAVDSRFGAGLLIKVDLAFGPVSAKQQQVAVTSLGEAFVGEDLGALVGSDVLGAYWVGFDYRAPAAYLLSAAPPEALPLGGTGPAAEATFVPVLGIPVVDGTARDATGAAGDRARVRSLSRRHGADARREDRRPAARALSATSS
jgi:hypothetical protein